MDYGLDGTFHEFAIVDGGKKLLILSAEDTKARFWMTTIAREIERLRNPSTVISDTDVLSRKQKEMSIVSFVVVK